MEHFRRNDDDGNDDDDEVDSECNVDGGVSASAAAPGRAPNPF